HLLIRSESQFPPLPIEGSGLRRSKRPMIGISEWLIYAVAIIANVDPGMEEDKMAQQEHVYLLKRGVPYWNQWRQQNPNVMPDLSNMDLAGATLINVDFSRVNLCMANLSGANLSMANLREANLSMANLSEAVLRMANLRATNMQAANAREADLRDADLRTANLKVADLSATDLRGANLEGALLDMTILDHAKGRRKGFWNLFS
ncbi:MAG TPA: pentapeptide repeat-containing protein, partial [Ktedonobacteraceae bacterium]|nr:pentapeptide repeat-containing protein [Ktedonobacteraceae bacterium]